MSAAGVLGALRLEFRFGAETSPGGNADALRPAVRFVVVAPPADFRRGPDSAVFPLPPPREPHVGAAAHFMLVVVVCQSRGLF